MSLDRQYLLLKGMEAGIAVEADSAFFESLPLIFSHWPYEITSGFDGEVFATVTYSASKYTLDSPFMEKSAPYTEPVNVICALVAELAWARLREDPSLLCLHGAAAEISGRLVVFPATRRAGKSTLSVALAANGIRLFTDDFLPISVASDGTVSGISSGVSPRLRLPLPAQIGHKATHYLEQRPVLSNGQYTYVSPLNTESATFGEVAPLGAIVILSREDDAGTELKEISKAEALKTLIYQNFSRAGNAAGILAMLEFLAKNLPVYQLTYDEVEPAIGALNEQFSTWDKPLPAYHPAAPLGNEIADGVKSFAKYADTSCGQFEHAAGVHVVSADGQRFLTGRNGQSIHYLNEGAALIWQILSEPTSEDEAIELLLAAFPEQERRQIEEDVRRSFANFGQNGLLQKLEAAPVLEPYFAADAAT